MSKSKIKANLTIWCCGVKHNPRNPETYERFFLWKNIYKKDYPLTKEGIKVHKTLTYELICKKHNCTKAKVLKYNKKGELLEVEEFSKEKAALLYLNNIKLTAEEIAINPPIKLVPYARRVGLFYGYGLNNKNIIEQRNTDGFTKGERFLIKTKVFRKTFKKASVQKLLMRQNEN